MPWWQGSTNTVKLSSFSQIGFQGYHICENDESLVLNLLVLHTDVSLRSISKLLQDRPGRCKGNIEARSRNHCCRQKTKSIIYSVALVIQHEKRVSHITQHLWPDSFTVFSHITSTRYDFPGGGEFNMKCVCFDFLYEFCLKHFSFYEDFREIFYKFHFWPCKWSLFVFI